MAYSYVKYTGNGTTTDYSISFTYLSKDYLEVKVNNVLTTAYTLPTASTLKFTTAPPNGQAVEIRRNTPKTARLVDFQDASILTEASLDLDSDQAFHITQETHDLSVDGVGQAVVDAAASSAANAAAAAASYDSFDDRYLGAKAAAPTLDNDGAALLTGALYWDTAGKIFKAWDGAAWASFTVNAQPIDATLTALAALDAVVGLVEQTGADVFTKRVIATDIKSFLNAADNAAARISLGVSTGTVTNVTGTAPIAVATGTTTPAISIPAATATVAGHMTAAYASKLDGIQAGAIAGVAKDNGHNAVGSFCFAGHITNNTAVGAGLTYAGSSLEACGFTFGTDPFTSTASGALAGTWRSLGYAQAVINNAARTLFQRIA